MVTPLEVQAAGSYGPIDVDGHAVLVSVYRSTTVDGRPLSPGTWHEVSSGDGQTVYGYIQFGDDEVHAFYPYQAGATLGETLRDYHAAIRHLVAGS